MKNEVKKQHRIFMGEKSVFVAASRLSLNPFWGDTCADKNQNERAPCFGEKAPPFVRRIQKSGESASQSSVHVENCFAGHSGWM